MMISEYDQLEAEQKRTLLQSCCGSQQWIDKMVEEPPFEDLVNMLDAAERLWDECSPEEWKEGFKCEPGSGEQQSGEGIPGADRESQQGASENDREMRKMLATAGADYEKKFGYKFIICDSGKSAAEKYAAVQLRLNNTPEQEIQVAADEHFQVMRREIEKLFL
ncbi:OHCU decarboxylase [Segetibacter sp. 3557_3]|uniref:2-oxo-4-hydroxy-4-carboxy-5-ureidoimidazoline decarboxylase n=1 Tax=Segetibacter sp. 3557_3 TaxID=2547429 RepID=UPI001058652A|nr:2-oxo-4-hydroxy-4-carboxy-5-ureidoimidazoline decarboxylase [Segetibacter sp. 3557_3]TDH29204.1 OHCU decarboxylase [Segetibacter sp. 3557_3]